MAGRLLRVAAATLAGGLTVAGCGLKPGRDLVATAERPVAAVTESRSVPEPLALVPDPADVGAVPAPSADDPVLAAPPAPVPAPAKPAVEAARSAPSAPSPVKRAAPVQPGGLVNQGGDRHATVEPREIGMIEIPKLGIAHPVVEGIELAQLHWGPGHWPGAAMPGQNGNVVFAGHRVTHTRPFLDIDLLVPGDQVIFKMPNGTFVYEVTGSQVVSPSAVHIVDQTPDPTMTLFACHPKHSARQRYVVRGRLLPNG